MWQRAPRARGEWRGWSDREIARRTSTSAPFVTKIRGELTVNIYSEPDEPRTYTTKHGAKATMRTENIGRRPVSPFLPTGKRGPFGPSIVAQRITPRCLDKRGNVR